MTLLLSDDAAALPADVATGLSAAYTLRRPRRSYTGPAVNVRRASDNAQLDIGFAGDDFDLATFNAFLASTTGFVTKWYEPINGFHMLQPTAANQPQIVATGGGTRNRPRILFSAASSKFLSISSVAILPLQASAGTDSGSTIYAVGAATPAAGNLEIVSNWDTPNSGHAYFLGIATTVPTVRFSDGAQSAGTLASPGTTWQLTVRKSAGASPSAYVTRQAGAQIASGTSANPAITSTIWAIGKQGDYSGGEFWDGEIDELLIGDATSTMSAVESNQRSYFGTP